MFSRTRKKPKTITQEKMHGRHIIDHREHARKVSLFPFFDTYGKVHCHMMVDLKAGEVWFIDDPALVEAGFFNGLCYKSTIPKSAEPTPEQVSVFRKLYHYDPWWVLAEEPFRHAWWVPAMKGTNVGERPDLEGLAFDRKLTQTIPEIDLTPPAPAPTQSWRIKNTDTQWTLPTWKQF